MMTSENTFSVNFDVKRMFTFESQKFAYIMYVCTYMYVESIHKVQINTRLKIFLLICTYNTCMYAIRRYQNAKALFDIF